MAAAAAARRDSDAADFRKTKQSSPSDRARTMKLPAAVPRGARCTATAALLSVAIQLQATRVRSTAVTLSNVALPKDQNGEQLITGEASSMAHEGSWYFYFNNWQLSPPPAPSPRARPRRTSSCPASCRSPAFFFFNICFR